MCVPTLTLLAIIGFGLILSIVHRPALVVGWSELDRSYSYAHLQQGLAPPGRKRKAPAAMNEYECSSAENAPIPLRTTTPQVASSRDVGTS